MLTMRARPDLVGQGAPGPLPEPGSQQGVFEFLQPPGEAGIVLPLGQVDDPDILSFLESHPRVRALGKDRDVRAQVGKAQGHGLRIPADASQMAIHARGERLSGDVGDVHGRS